MNLHLTRIFNPKGIVSSTFRKCDGPVPEGHCENSPAFQRWVVRPKTSESRRDERASRFRDGFLPSLRDLSRLAAQPSVETLGYGRMSLRDNRRLWAGIPLGFGPAARDLKLPASCTA